MKCAVGFHGPNFDVLPLDSANKGLGSRSWPEIKLFRGAFKLEKGGQFPELNENTFFQEGKEMLQRILTSRMKKKELWNWPTLSFTKSYKSQ